MDTILVVLFVQLNLTWKLL